MKAIYLYSDPNSFGLIGKEFIKPGDILEGEMTIVDDRDCFLTPDSWYLDPAQVKVINFKTYLEKL